MKKVLLIITFPIWLPLSLIVGVIGLALALAAFSVFLLLSFFALLLPAIAVVGMILACAFIFSDFFSFIFFISFGLLLISLGRLLWWVVSIIIRSFWVLVGRKKDLSPKKRNWRGFWIVCIVAGIMLAISIANHANTGIYIDETGLHLSRSLQTFSRLDFPNGFQDVSIDTIGQNVEIVYSSNYFVETWSRQSEPLIGIDGEILRVTSAATIDDVKFDLGWGDFRAQNLIRIHAPEISNIRINTNSGDIKISVFDTPFSSYTLSSYGKLNFCGETVTSPFAYGSEDVERWVQATSVSGDIKLDLLGRLLGNEFVPEHLLE